MAIVDLADEFHLLAVDERLDALCEVGPIRSPYLRRDLQRQPGSTRELDRRLRPLFRRNAPDECEVPFWSEIGGEEIARQAVMDRTSPVRSS
jgi:hypothetical protein